jgi:multiple sugar transport system substrate-binding protein
VIELRGLTWAHTRGFAPLAALGRVWEDRRPDVRVTWTARSLWSFGEEPLEPYLDDFDLLVFDYPMAGEAVVAGWVVPLERLVPADVLAARRAGTVSPLHDAFAVPGGQAALALDVASHVAVSRPDLLAARGLPLPADWAETVALAKETGIVAMPMRPTGVWGGFLTLCAHTGDTPLHRADGRPFDPDAAADALEKLRALAALVDPACFETYPTALLNRMAETDAIAFMPLTYGYSTYGVPGYAAHPLAFHDARLGGPVRGAVLGGAGIGVSARSRHAEAAAEHLLWLTSPEVQSTLFVRFGGQPAQRAAWEAPAADALVGGFFAATRRSADTAYVRANGPGFHHFQNAAADRLHAAVTGAAPIGDALKDVAALWAGIHRPR